MSDSSTLNRFSIEIPFIPSQNTHLFCHCRFPHDDVRGGPRARESRSILQSSFKKEPLCVIPYGNGFVRGAICAFEQDLHLVLRPDDIWLAILTQFSLFVNNKAEELRSKFVAHEGKKDLILDIRPLSIWDQDIGSLARKMTKLLEENIVGEC